MLADILMLLAAICIWLLLLVNVMLIVAGYFYYVRCEREPAPELPAEAPYVSVLVPAHNEGLVIRQTLEALLAFDYPADRYEIIVVNDNSTDDSRDVLMGLQARHPHRNLMVIHTDASTGGRGKSHALNLALSRSKGELIAVYDADNTPEKQALRYLAAELCRDDSLGAVIGKFRTRNRDVGILTRFINIETLSFQWMTQAGRWQLFRLCTIPGTNFMVRKKLADDIGGWDERALAEDTELSFRIYLEGYRIKFQPKAVTWEQEPQTVRVWFKQRTRWAKGNVYVVLKNLPLLFRRSARRIHFDIAYFIMVYFLLVSSLVISDVFLLLHILGYVYTTIAGLSMFLWLLAILLFVIGTFTTLTTEKGEMTLSNLWLIVLMYATYCQMWLLVAAYGLFQFITDWLFRKEVKWYKTERY